MDLICFIVIPRVKSTSKEELKGFMTHENQDSLEDEKAGIFTNVGADERSQKGKTWFQTFRGARP